MIIVCTCGQKSRVRDLTMVNRLRCGACKAVLHETVQRQATRNSDIVLEVAAYLLAKPEKTWTKEEEVIARILHAHHTA